MIQTLVKQSHQRYQLLNPKVFKHFSPLWFLLYRLNNTKEEWETSKLSTNSTNWPVSWTIGSDGAKKMMIRLVTLKHTIKPYQTIKERKGKRIKKKRDIFTPAHCLTTSTLCLSNGKEILRDAYRLGNRTPLKQHPYYSP